jgi:hypothetical protein
VTNKRKGSAQNQPTTHGKKSTAIHHSRTLAKTRALTSNSTLTNSLHIKVNNLSTRGVKADKHHSKDQADTDNNNNNHTNLHNSKDRPVKRREQ